MDTSLCRTHVGVLRPSGAGGKSTERPERRRMLRMPRTVEQQETSSVSSAPPSQFATPPPGLVGQTADQTQVPTNLFLDKQIRRLPMKLNLESSSWTLKNASVEWARNMVPAESASCILAMIVCTSMWVSAGAGTVPQAGSARCLCFMLNDFW